MSGGGFKDENGAVWCVSVTVPTDRVALFEDALAPYCDALSWLEVGSGREVCLNGYTPIRPDEGALKKSVAMIAEAGGIAISEVEISSVAPRDWVMESLKTFPPVRAGRYFIHGSHLGGGRAQGEVSLCIDAGAAFGTGTHESTSGCLTLMDRMAKHRNFIRVLDVGCGSGILALAAAKTWTGAEVLGFDIDPRAVQTAKQNAVINGQRDRIAFLVSGGYHHPKVRRHRGKYDLIVSNILARPLMRLARGMARNLAPGGVGILAGFLVRDEPRVFAAHRMQGLCLAGRVEQNGWVALAVAKGRRS